MASDLAMVLGRTGSRTSESFLIMVTMGPQPAAGTGHDDVSGGAPAELLRDLVAVGLGAFRVVRADIDVDEGPAVLVADLGAKTVDLVVGALDGHEGGSIDERGDDLAALEVRGDEDIGLEPGFRRVRGHRVGEVAR